MTRDVARGAVLGFDDVTLGPDPVVDLYRGLIAG